MKSFRISLRSVRPAVLAVAAWLMASNAHAQGAVGSGPLTSTLADSEPQGGVINVGPLRVAPGLTVHGIGVDDNVFDESVDPKDDFLIAATPDVSVFARLRFAQISTYVGSDMQYYRTYESERSIGHSLKARIDLLSWRLSPFVGAAQIHNRARPNGEIDVRADTESEEFSGGIGYELSPTSKVYGAAIKTDVDYEDAFQDNVSLDQSLSHTTTEYSGGFKTALTPLTTMLVRGGVRKDEFPTAPDRNGENRLAAITLSFDPSAIISGTASFGYQDYLPNDPLVSRYQGMTANVSIRYPLLELGHFNFGYQHGIDYSFDVQEAYYVSNSINVAYTQRLFGEVDLQASGTWGQFDYGQRVGSLERQDSIDIYNGNLGYNLRNRTRVAMNYELAERHSPAVAARNYVRRRIYLSWLVAF